MIEKIIALIQKFILRLIVLEILYACLHSSNVIHINNYAPQAWPEIILLTAEPVRGWYWVGDCSTVPAQEMQTNTPGICLSGPYAALYLVQPMNYFNKKYGRRTFYIK